VAFSPTLLPALPSEWNGGSGQFQLSLLEARSELETRLHDAVARLVPPLRAMADYHFGWADEKGWPGNFPRGRRRLGVLVLLCSAATGGDWQRAMPGAVAFELVSNSAVIQDDLLDGDALRRERTAIWSLFGLSAAVLLSNVLTALAFETLAEAPSAAADPAARRLSQAIAKVNAGQQLDIDFEARTDVTADECLTMSMHKGGGYAEGACAVGAVFANSDRVESFAAYGKRLGTAWQMHNDVLGIWGDPADTGKPVLSDLKSRKKTLPVVVALRTTSPAGAQLAELYRSAQHRLLSDEETALAAELIARCESRHRTEQQAQEQLDAAVSLLHAAAPDSDARRALTSLARHYAASTR
jgi:geranylgeranyl diphosphate synthase, type I